MRALLSNLKTLTLYDWIMIAAIVIMLAWITFMPEAGSKSGLRKVNSTITTYHPATPAKPL